jgi:dTMP kinase
MFIVFEGIDGSGKSTQAEKLAATLRDELGKPVLLTCEPTRSQLGSYIRGDLQFSSEDNPGLDDVALALLFVADRTYHLERVIKPALEADIMVICDRYVLSSLAYQTTESQEMGTVLKFNAHFPKPDVTFYLDVSVAESLRRVSGRGRARDKFETEAQLRAIRHRYERALELVGNEHRVHWVNAEADPDLVSSTILQHLYP